jgi:uncharacterized protein (TIGR02145 family)
MKTKNFLLLLVVLIFFSCETPERNNPFDPECPKEIWTPRNFQAVKEGVAVKLTWNIPTANFEGFRITKRVNNGSIISLGDFPKSVNEFIDNNVVGGQQLIYTIYAYAGNNQSNSLDAQITPILMPSIITNPTSLIGTKSVTLDGLITSNGGAQVIERGFCWSTNLNPTIADNKIINQSVSNNFSNNVFGLNESTIYYVRAYAKNNQGVGYGNQVTFSTLGYGTLTDIDNNVYSTITIGTQVWMVQNLKTTKYKNGTPIQNITNSWSSVSSGAYCWYNNDITYKNIYGALYNFYSVNTGNLAPSGWHIPSDSEWSVLINYLGGVGNAEAKLREVGVSHWSTPNSGATNESGFTALPGGRRFSGYPVNEFVNISNYGFWWSSSTGQNQNGEAKYRGLSYDGAIFGENGSLTFSVSSGHGLSVRCIKN